MKRKIIALVAGAALIAAPLMTNFATANTPGGGRSGRMERLAKKLNLNETQKTQLKAIHEETKAKMQAVFTPEQKAQIEAKRAERKQRWQEYKENGGQRPEGRRRGRKGRRGMFKELNLSDAQKAELKQIRQEAKAAKDAVLTDAQKAQLQEMKQQRRARREQRQNAN
ncbi:P pilus assembly/Cpx signaling pathway, periplasmic inhibitor/zinc-resistance associated protein [filamentous cyanobacterium LEGE 11480]|uniref:P pilus assembly/Cpx signaling pathway, periplasmic inhibitor/zinc-resistance associated protein n=1 Tax=Romeriopsis navalis LEGE 11480 TaxID=2777977 RepID=A0A928VN55_9CYAN|nr:hypothetical protein [Romeriopsis navalis]MBE9029756.1 P pilus assembly/Cpx signaling pathway, periplasmic inhibitor/zinc-resistance associated protein [Romeriopsis navalis LEGE 11480]